MNDAKTREELLELLRQMSENSSKFAPKLTFAQRCEILALHHAGVRREVLSKMYNVDKRTVTHIYNPLSPHYRNVREQEVGFGIERFRDLYVSNDLMNIALAAGVKEVINNKLASGKAGIHIVRGKMCSYDHRVAIQWIEAGQHGTTISGWYYRDLDGDFPETWFIAGGPESMRNSQACYAAMLNDITDKL